MWRSARVIAATYDLGRAGSGSRDAIRTVRVICGYMPNGQAPGSDKFEYKLAWFRGLRDWVRDQLAAHPALVLMGDFNQWGAGTGAMRELGSGWQSLVPGRSFPAHNPVAQLDRIVACTRWRVVGQGVHHSALAAKASDHLPVWAKLELPAI